MPRYYFHTTGFEPFLDNDGIELADDDAAWAAAVKSCGELLRDLGGRLADNATLIVRVEDEAKRSVAQVQVNGSRGGSA